MRFSIIAALVLLVLAACLAHGQRPPEGKVDPEEIDATDLSRPPFEREMNGEALELVELRLVGSCGNNVTDYGVWFWHHYINAETYHEGGVNDAIRGDSPPEGVPWVIEDGGETLHLYQVIWGWDSILASYGQPPNRFDVVLYPTVLISVDYDDGSLRWALDFSEWAQGGSRLVDEIAVFQATRWAEERNGILYVSHFHRTYSASSGGQNAYLTAMDLQDMSIIWRSRPLVSNSDNFIIIGDTIVTGYGFTDEDDFVFLINRLTGEVYDTIPVQTSPDYFCREGDRLFVRCYDTDYEFQISPLD